MAFSFFIIDIDKEHKGYFTLTKSSAYCSELVIIDRYYLNVLMTAPWQI